MDRCQRILVGLELAGDAVSPGSWNAVEQALWLAGSVGGSVTFLHSVFRPRYRDSKGVQRPVGLERPDRRGAAALGRALAEARRLGVPAELEVTTERAWLDATRRALGGEVDLVVVGKRNEPAADGRALGTVAVKLLRKCPCPVWAVKPGHDLVHRCVLAASDLSPVADEVVDAAAWVAGRGECQLTVVHAWSTPLDLRERREELGAEAFEAHRDGLRAGAGEHIRAGVAAGPAPGVEHDVLFGKGRPAGVIREAVDHLDPDLLVMGTVSTPDLPGRSLGSTAERVLDRVDCSLLALKPAGFRSSVSPH
ncbi:MAG: universal stress protein [Planctomycetota bacterium]|jgi:universal stress protein E|nr:universal stress protein [Planctomycetota bacterium]MDP6989090.1 universal stress protein [Planctomycetota bacterium]